MPHMETTTIRTTKTGGRTAAVNALAIVGFIVLLILGMALAIYAASYVPKAVSRIGAAAVYLSSTFSKDGETTLEVVTPDETVPFGDDVVVATSTATTTVVVTPAPVTTGGGTVTTVRPIGTTGGAVTLPLSGLPDLVVENVVTGYLTSTNTSSFRAADEVPDGERGAFKFTIRNQGTNASGRFEFDATLPTSRAFTYSSSIQQSLNPGERIEYVLGFDRTKDGENRKITITVDPDEDIRESNEGNNTRSVTIDIEK